MRRAALRRQSRTFRRRPEDHPRGKHPCGGGKDRGPRVRHCGPAAHGL